MYYSAELMNKLIKYSILLLCLTILSVAHSQQSISPNGTELKGKVSISDNNATPSSSAILDIQSTTKGVRLPVMTSTQRKAIANPTRGLTVFDSDYLTLFLHDGYNWYPLAKTNTQYLPAISRSPSSLSNAANFGSSVSIEGEFIVAGAPNQNNSRGEVFIYERTGGVWNLKTQITGNDLQTNDLFGSSVLIRGNYIIVSARGSNSNRGAVYVFEKSGNIWQQKQKITANDAQNDDYFGHSIAFNATNNLLAVSAVGKNSSKGSVYTFSFTNNQWNQNTILIASNGGANHQFGFSISLENSYLVIGAPFQNSSKGEVYIFQQNFNGMWSEILKLGDIYTKQGDRFGYSVSVSGNTIAVSSPGDSPQKYGIIKFYMKSFDGNWYAGGETLNGKVNDGNFGSSIHLSGNYLIVAAETEDVNGVTDKGSAYVYFKSSRYSSFEHWEILRKIYANDSSSETFFGKSVSINNGSYVVGQPSKYNAKGEIFMGKIE